MARLKPAVVAMCHDSVLRLPAFHYISLAPFAKLFLAPYFQLSQLYVGYKLFACSFGMLCAFTRVCF